MALLQTCFYSNTLGMQSRMNVILPEAAQGIGLSTDSTARNNIPVLYLLHGLSDDESIWLRRTSIERYAARRQMAVIMPCGGKSFYCNTLSGDCYWDFISTELPQIVQSFFHLSPNRENTFVAGLSMGGYGALKLALSQPERFCAAASFSGALDLAEMMENNCLPSNPLTNIFHTASEIKNSPQDVYSLLESPTALSQKPRLYVNCGIEDIFLEANRRFVQQASSLGYSVTASETPNRDHCWELWNEQIEKALDWMGI